MFKTTVFGDVLPYFNRPPMARGMHVFIWFSSPLFLVNGTYGKGNVHIF